MPSTSAIESAIRSRLLAQPAAEAGAAVLDRQRAVHGRTVPRAQPYQTGTVSQVRAGAAERAPRRLRLRRWWKRP